MKNYEPVMTFNEETAESYDSGPVHAGNDPGEPAVGDADATVTFLEELAHGGPALELAIGTGRIALPLSARGITIDGIDFSEAMVDKLRAKPGGDRLSVTMGNYADVDVSGTYRLVYIVANSLSNLLTQDEQVHCFENVAAHLTEDGSFVLEAGVPSWLYRLQNSQYVMAEGIEVDEVRLDVARVDRRLRGVGEKDHHDVGLTHGVGHVEHRKPGVLGLRARRRARAQADPNVVPGVLQVQRVRMALTPEPEDRDALIRQRGGVGVLLVVDRRHRVLGPSFGSFGSRITSLSQTSRPTQCFLEATASIRAVADRFPWHPEPELIDVRALHMRLDDAGERTLKVAHRWQRQDGVPRGLRHWL